MKLADQQVRSLCAHMGYGDPSAPLWFVGTEEGLGGATTQAENDRNLLARCSWAPVMDMHEAHLTLREKGCPIDISQPRAGHIGVWQWIAKIARAFAGQCDFETVDGANLLIRSPQGLGRSGGETFLTEL